jgi:hypothetical protein
LRHEGDHRTTGPLTNDPAQQHGTGLGTRYPCSVLRRSLFAPLVLTFSTSIAQQVPDSAFTYSNATPAYAAGEGPIVLLDEAPFNFHTLGGRYYPFGQILSQDGYTVQPGTAAFTASYLDRARILVISNALADDGPWQLPAVPAFDPSEREVVKEWVRNGGSLFLIADHLPFGGAAADLASAFGFNWINGYALRNDKGPEFFSRKAGTLSANVITNGAREAERVDSIQCFTGSAFLVPTDAVPITAFSEDYRIFLPQRAGVFNDTTAWIDGRYFTNGAFLSFGKGRVVAFGEAAMFSAQLQGPDRKPMGMNQHGAEQDPQLLLNIIHWLDHRLE